MLKSIKIVVAGDIGVGRTKLVMAWDKGECINESNTKIHESYNNFIKGSNVDGDLVEAEVQDLPTEDRVRYLKTHFVSSNCAVIVFAVSSLQSFQNLTLPIDDPRLTSAKMMDSVPKEQPIVLVGSKTDLTREVDSQAVDQLRSQYSNIKEYLEYHHGDWSAIENIFKTAVRLGKDYDPPSDEEGDDEPHQPKEESCCIIL